MNKIQSLKSDLVDQIAAGEVIDRPASVLKELIENSIDANSNKIDVNILRGGHELIQVSDNGSGMNKSDLKSAFKRHATSKISSLNDLYNINSFGFRGEALPSIASISMTSAKSSYNNSDTHILDIHGGKQVKFEPTRQINGTNIEIKNLFYNVPARRKFLKKPETEQSLINSTFRRYMLSNSNISFKLQNNNKITYNVKAESLSDRIASIYGNNFKKNIIEISYKKESYNISGYIGNLSLVKKTKNEQYLYLNGRYIKDRLLSSAIYSAYQSLINRGEYPFFVLFIDMPTDKYDINVHPAKLEAKFSNEWQVYHTLKASISNALKNILHVIPEYTNFNNRQSYHNENESFNFNKSLANYNNTNNLQNNSIELEISNDSVNSKITKIKNNQNNHNELELVKNQIWQIHNKYLITEITSGLIIIDQHVAHERVLFEEAKIALNGNGFASQTLLFPQTLSLQPEDFDSLTDISHYLEKIGFKFREFGENTIIIEGIPPNVKWGNEKNIITEIIDQYNEVKSVNPSFIEQLAAIYSCKSAIKAGDKLLPEERINLIDKLFSTEHPYYCPHGRPIIINLSVDELDQRFERI